MTAEPVPAISGAADKKVRLKRRANLLYKLRRKGIEADTRLHVIFIPYGDNPWRFPQVLRLNQEYNFNIQFIIT